MSNMQSQYNNEMVRSFKTFMRSLSSNTLELNNELINFMIRLVINHDGRLISEVPNNFVTEELCELAVKSNAYAIGYMPHRFVTEELCHLAISNKGSALGSIPEELTFMITHNMCLNAIRNDLGAIQFVPKFFQSPQIMLEYYKISYMSKRIRYEEIPQEYTHLIPKVNIIYDDYIYRIHGY